MVSLGSDRDSDEEGEDSAGSIKSFVRDCLRLVMKVGVSVREVKGGVSGAGGKVPGCERVELVNCLLT